MAKKQSALHREPEIKEFAKCAECSNCKRDSYLPRFAICKVTKMPLHIDCITNCVHYNEINFDTQA